MPPRRRFFISTVVALTLALYVYARLAHAPIYPGRRNPPGATTKTTTTRTIIRATDGDTLVLDGNERVRIIGVDTPELRKKVNGHWQRLPNPAPAAMASSNYMKSLVGQKVKVEYGVQPRDRYGRSLCHLYLLPNGPDIATHLLKSGWARIMAIPPNDKRKPIWKKALRARKAVELDPNLQPGRLDARTLQHPIGGLLPVAVAGKKQ